MNIGYAMIAIIMLNILINLVALLVTSCLGLARFMRRNCCASKKRTNYEIRDDDSPSANTSNGKFF